MNSPSCPQLLLAPMQDVTDLAFLRTLTALGVQADVYVTPYFRVVSHSDHLERELSQLVRENPTGRPLFAQMIGSDPEALCRVAQKLEKKLPCAGIDLNIGCPAPIVCRKSAGGGALKDLAALEHILSRLRDSVSGPLSVKTRLGYESPDEWAALVALFKQYELHHLVVHGRTVKEGYKTAVHDDALAYAVQELPFPVIVNGNVVDVSSASLLVQNTSPHGLMIGRGAIRNPWIFDQIRDYFTGKEISPTSPQQIYLYTRHLFEETARLMNPYVEKFHINRLKKFLVYIMQGMPPEFDYQMRRATRAEDFHALTSEFLEQASTFPSCPPVACPLFAEHEKRTLLSSL